MGFGGVGRAEQWGSLLPHPSSSPGSRLLQCSCVMHPWGSRTETCWHRGAVPSLVAVLPSKVETSTLSPVRGSGMPANMEQHWFGHSTFSHSRACPSNCSSSWMCTPCSKQGFCAPCCFGITAIKQVMHEAVLWTGLCWEPG